MCIKNQIHVFTYKIKIINKQNKINYKNMQTSLLS